MSSNPTHFVPERAPRAALISPDPSLRSMVTSCLDDSGASVDWVLRADTDLIDLRPENVDRLAERGPEVLFLDVGTSPSVAVQFITAITERLPGLILIAAGGALDVDELLALLRAGAAGYLRRPWNRQEITAVCMGLLRKVPTQPQPVEPDVPAPAVVSNVIALFAPKGGTGVSTLSANLAVHMRRATSKRTLVVDLAPELGTCSVLMGVAARYSYLDVIANLQRMDEGLLYSFLDEHESGAWVMSSPEGAPMSRELSAERVNAILRLARRYFEYVVVDVGRGFMDQAALQALESADERLVVTTAELPTLRNVKEILSRVTGGAEPADAVRLVVNRYEEGVSVPLKDVESAVGIPMFQLIDEDRERVGRSVNLGRPLVMNGSSPYARAVEKLGDRLAADGDLPAKRRRSGLGGLLELLPSFGRKNGQGEAVNGARRQPTGRPHDSSERHRGPDRVRHEGGVA